LSSLSLANKLVYHHCFSISGKRRNNVPVSAAPACQAGWIQS
jgi:hypothetical protein